MKFIPLNGLSVQEYTRKVSDEEREQALAQIPEVARAFMTASDLIVEALRVPCSKTLWIGAMRSLAAECERVLVYDRPADKRASLLAAFERYKSVSAVLAALYQTYGVGREVQPIRLVFGPPVDNAPNAAIPLPNEVFPDVVDAIDQFDSDLQRPLKVIFYSWFAAVAADAILPPPPDGIPPMDEGGGDDDGEAGDGPPAGLQPRIGG